MKAIEVFCCSGGMAEGFRRAGIEFAYAFDKDPNACASYEKNLGDRPICMDVRDLLRMVKGAWLFGATGDDLDLIVADPPCTPYSLAGKRLGPKDERDMLRQTCEIIALLRPRAYLIGNVPGLDTADNWPIVQELIGTFLANEGYCVLDYASLDAADFGVPQHRVRPFWFGHRSGPCIRWPERTHAAPHLLGLPGVASLEPWVTVKQALSHLPPGKIGRTVKTRGRIRGKDGSTREHVPDQPGKTVTASRTGRERVMLDPVDPHPRHPISKADEPSFVIKCNGGRDSQGASMCEWPWERPSTTVTTRDALPPPGHHPETGSILSQPNAVVLSELAAAILQGFPESWVFAGKTKISRWSQIGQAMPPALAAAVARSVAEQIRRTEDEMFSTLTRQGERGN